MAKDATLGERLQLGHMTLNYLTLCLVGLHVAASLKHHLVDRDGMLARMLPGTITR